MGKDNMIPFITDINPVAFFKKYIHRVCKEADINVFEKFLQIDYLSKMLSEYVDPERYFGDKGELIRLIDSLKSEAETTHEAIEGYKKTADRILFYHSFFPEAFGRRLVNAKFYAKAARMFYGIVGLYKIPVCSHLSEEYSLWNFVLKTAKLRYMF